MMPQTPLPFSVSRFHCLPLLCMLHWDADYSYTRTRTELESCLLMHLFGDTDKPVRILCSLEKKLIINSRTFSWIQYLYSFLSLVPFTRSDIPGLCFCVWGQMCLRKPIFHCVERNVTIMPQKERTWYTLYSDSGNTMLQNMRQRFSFSFCFFPHYNFVFDNMTVRHIDRFMNTDSVQHSWHFESHYWHVWFKIKYQKVWINQIK